MDRAEARLWVEPHEDVFGDVEMGEELGVLMSRQQPRPARPWAWAKRTGLPSRSSSPLSAVSSPVHDLDDGRLAGAVLAEQRVDLGRLDGEADLLERPDPLEALGDAAKSSRRGGAGTQPRSMAEQTGGRLLDAREGFLVERDAVER